MSPERAAAFACSSRCCKAVCTAVDDKKFYLQRALQERTSLFLSSFRNASAAWHATELRTAMNQSMGSDGGARCMCAAYASSTCVLHLDVSDTCSCARPLRMALERSLTLVVSGIWYTKREQIRNQRESLPKSRPCPSICM
jgi:hypothetical protein